eukprot:6487439-Amphidinium_carterae.2
MAPKAKARARGAPNLRVPKRATAVLTADTWLEAPRCAGYFGSLSSGQVLELSVVSEGGRAMGTMCVMLSALHGLIETHGVFCEIMCLGTSSETVRRWMEQAEATGGGPPLLHLCGRQACRAPQVPGRVVLHCKRWRLRDVSKVKERWVDLSKLEPTLPPPAMRETAHPDRGMGAAPADSDLLKDFEALRQGGTQRERSQVGEKEIAAFLEQQEHEAARDSGQRAPKFGDELRARVLERTEKHTRGGKEKKKHRSRRRSRSRSSRSSDSTSPAGLPGGRNFEAHAQLLGRSRVANGVEQEIRLGTSHVHLLGHGLAAGYRLRCEIKSGAYVIGSGGGPDYKRGGRASPRHYLPEVQIGRACSWRERLGLGLAAGVDPGPARQTPRLGCERPRTKACVIPGAAKTAGVSIRSKAKGGELGFCWCSGWAGDKEGLGNRPGQGPWTCPEAVERVNIHGPPADTIPQSKGRAETCTSCRKRKRTESACTTSADETESKGEAEGSKGERAKREAMKLALSWLTAEIDACAARTPRQTRQRSDVLPLPIPPSASWNDVEIMRVWRGEVISCDVEEIALTDGWLRVLVRGLNLHDGKECGWKTPSQIQKKCLRALRDQCLEFVRLRDLNFGESEESVRTGRHC